MVALTVDQRDAVILARSLVEEAVDLLERADTRLARCSIERPHLGHALNDLTHQHVALSEALR